MPDVKKLKAFSFEYKDIDTKGNFTGYASVFDVVDSYNDVVAKGAFKRTLNHSSGKVPILWQHNTRSPIGVGLSAKEDKRGLWVEGAINQDVQQGREARSLILQGAIKGLSIGYSVVVDEWDRKTGIRTLKELKLWEYSPVTFPANEEAGISDIKTFSVDDLSDAELDRLRVLLTSGKSGLDPDLNSDSEFSSLRETINEMKQYANGGI